MKFEKRIYKELKVLLEELGTEKNLETINKEYVLRYLDNSALLKLLGDNTNKFPKLNEAILKDHNVLEQVIKLIALMEVSDTWEDFEKLIAKRKNNSAVDFDKILIALAKLR